MEKKMKRIEHEELWVQVYRQLLQALKDDTYRERGRLPAEENVAKSLGVSRTVMRDALAVLESEGYITRKRGVGTVINQEVVDAISRLDLENDFEVMINREGYTSSQKILSCEREEEGIVVKKIYYASGQPAIYLKDVIPTERLSKTTDVPSLEVCEQHSFYDLLEKEGWGSIETVLMDVEPLLYGQVKSELPEMDLSEYSIILKTVERGFDVYGKINLLSTIYYVSDLFRFSLLCKVGHH